MWSRRLVRYGLVGMLGASIHFGTLILLVRAGMPPVPASVMGFVLTVLVSYLLNYYWTFEAKRVHRSSLPRYVVITVSGLILNASVMYLTVEVWEWDYRLGQTVAVILIPLSNFLLSSVWAFRGH